MHKLTNILNRRRLSALALVAGLISPGLGYAVEFTVNSGGDGTDTNLNDNACIATTGGCTLRAAIQQTNAMGGADTIKIPSHIDVQLTSGSQGEDSAELGDLDITDSLTIVGEKSGKNKVYGIWSDRIFHISGANIEVTLKNIRVSQGYIIANTDDENRLPKNSEEIAGGGIYIGGKSKVTLDNIEVSNNTVTVSTSGNSTFASSGGGIYIDVDATVTIENSEITGNSGTSGGGITNLGRTVIRKSNISGNDLKSQMSGGGILNSGGYLTVWQSTISGNSANGNGGGIYTEQRGVNVGALIVSNSTVSNNYAKLFGGGISGFAPYTVINSTISGNTAGRLGGGLQVGGPSSINVLNSTISGNKAESGGGIYTTARATIIHATVYGNASNPCSGGEDECFNSGHGGNQLSVAHSGDSNTSVTVANSIFADVIGFSEAKDTACSGPTGYAAFIRSEGGNVENGSSCNLVAGGAHNDAVNAVVTPSMGPLEKWPIDKGFSDTAVHALLSGSPAIDRGLDGQCPKVDQRSMVRNVGNSCDSGSFEFGATEFLGTDITDLKLEITDDPDPVLPIDQQLTYSTVVENLYDTTATAVIVTISLPNTFIHGHTNTTTFDGDQIECGDPTQTATTIDIVCQMVNLSALGRVEIDVTGTVSSEGTIQASATVFSGVTDVFPQNNSDIESTVVSIHANSINNFGAANSGGGGGAINLFSVLAALLLLPLYRRRA